MNRLSIKNGVGIVVLFLLGLNFLLYAFFPLEEYKNFLRAFIAILILFYLVFIKVKYIKQELLCLTLSAMIILVNGNMALNIAFLLLSYFCISEVNELSKISFRISIVLLIFFLLGIVTHYVSINIYTMGERTRNTLGFYNVNAASLFFYSLIILFLYSRPDIKITHMVVSLVITYLVFLETDSRTSLIGVIAFCIFVVVLKLANNHVQYIKPIAIAITIFCFASPIIWIIPSINSIKYNILLSERPYVFNQFINQNSIVNLLIGGTSANEIDNFYLMFLFNVGIVLYALFAFITVKSLLCLFQEFKYKEISFVISILLVGLMESSALRSEILCMIVFWNIILKTMFSQIKTNDSSLNEN